MFGAVHFPGIRTFDAQSKCMRLIQLLPLFLPVLTTPLGAQPGCTDPLANNFNSNASVNDGSCGYATTNYSPTLKTDLSTTLKESSGQVLANGALWMHNDGGDDPKIYRVDTLSNSILQTVTIGGASNIDWEDMAFDGSNFYIGDFGNNANGNRTDLKIYKFPISAIPVGADVTVSAAQVDLINFSYEDQVDFSPTGSNNTSFDCEALFFYKDGLHLFTKNWINNTTAHYSLPATAGTYQATKLETFQVNGLITAADISPLGVILLLGYHPLNSNAFFWMMWDYPVGIFFSGNKRRIELGSAFSIGQVEGVCFRGNGDGYISNEAFSVFVPARLYGFSIFQWLQPGFTVAAPSAAPERIGPCAVSPNPIAAGQIFFIETSPPGMPLEVEIWNGQGQNVWFGKSHESRLPPLAVGAYWVLGRNELGAIVCRSVILVH